MEGSSNARLSVSATSCGVAVIVSPSSCVRGAAGLSAVAPVAPCSSDRRHSCPRSAPSMRALTHPSAAGPPTMMNAYGGLLDAAQSVVTAGCGDPMAGAAQTSSRPRRRHPDRPKRGPDVLGVFRRVPADLLGQRPGDVQPSPRRRCARRQSAWAFARSPSATSRMKQPSASNNRTTAGGRPCRRALPVNSVTTNAARSATGETE